MGKRARPRALGALETRVMQVVWRRGPSTVHDVQAALKQPRPLAYTTILTTLRNLEAKGHLTHEVAGRQHVYRALVAERAAAQSALGELLDRVFEGSRAKLVDALFEEESLTRAEFDALRREVLDLRREERESDD